MIRDLDVVTLVAHHVGPRLGLRLTAFAGAKCHTHASFLGTPSRRFSANAAANFVTHKGMLNVFRVSEISTSPGHLREDGSESGRQDEKNGGRKLHSANQGRCSGRNERIGLEVTNEL
jgi:hypothetical protein